VTDTACVRPMKRIHHFRRDQIIAGWGACRKDPCHVDNVRIHEQRIRRITWLMTTAA
jgi:hypothetical protein